jgi:VWFA-related protein
VKETAHQMKLRQTLLLIIAVIALHQTGGAQSGTPPPKQEQPLRLSADLIQVRAAVTDKQGRVIDRLSKDDFLLLENDLPQRIEFFTVDRIEGKPADALSNKTNDKQAAQANPAVLLIETPRRSIVLFVDTVHIDHVRLARVKEALQRFVDQQMSDQDLVAVVSSGGGLGLLSQFTRDRQVLRAAINALAPWAPGGRDSLLTPYIAASVLRGELDALALAWEIVQFEEGLGGVKGAPDFYRNPKLAQQIRDQLWPRLNMILIEATYRRRAALATLDNVVARLADLPGARMILLFSEGFTQQSSSGGVDSGDLQPVISRATRAGIVTYSFDAKALEPVMVGADRAIFIHGEYLNAFMNRTNNELRDGMRRVALDTGGELFINTNDFNGRLQKVLDENRVSYVLAYYMQGDKDPKKLRRIKLQIKDHPDYIVRTEKGYRPADLEKAKASTEAMTPRQKLFQAMSAPLPVTTLGISAAADYLEREGDDLQIALQVYIDGDTPAYQESNGHYTGDLEIVTGVHDLSGKAVKVFTDNLHAELQAEQLAAARQNGYRYYKRFGLKPGRYQIRIGALETLSERLGTTSLWIEVPDLSQRRLCTSSLLVGNYPATKEHEVVIEGGSRPYEPRVKRGVRLYRSGEAMIYQMMIYPPSPQTAAADLTMQLQVFHGREPVFQSAWLPVTARMAGQDKKGIAVYGQLDLKTVPAGLYEFQITVKDAKTNQTALQTTSFGIER